MRRIILIISALAVLVSLLLATAALAAADDQDAHVSIVEPAFRPPREWNYAPGELTSAVGTTIIWTNAGAVVHTVTADDGVSFDSGTLDPQTAFSFTPDTAGTYSYHCTFHAWMTGTFTVTE